MTLRVGHVGTGTTGREALRAILTDPALELAGLWVTTPEKDGADAGTLCGLPEVGVRATTDLDAVLGLDLDCFSYGGRAVGREIEACEDMARFLEAGVDVVTFAVVSLVYPPAAPAELRDRLQDACERGGSTFFASGMEPGWATFALPYNLLSVAGEITGYREEQHALDMAGMYPVKEVVFGSMGFGHPEGSVPPRFVDGECARAWVPSLHVVADALGATIDDTRFTWEAHVTPLRLETRLGPVEAGTIGATYWRLAAVVGDNEPISVEYVSRVAPDAPVPEHWPTPPAGAPGGALVFRVEGRPQFSMHLLTEGAISSLAMTARHTINAIPAVVAARPGMVTPLDLGLYATRSADFGGHR